ncbi:MAG: hypothetical protein ABW000_03955 [Actinoplanes sp.]
MFSRRVLLLLDVLCVVGVLWSAVLIGGLLAGVRWLPTTLAVAVAGVLVLPGFTAGILTNRRAVRGRQPQSGWVRSVWAPPADLPRWGLILAGLLFLGFWVAGFTAFTGMDEPDGPLDTRTVDTAAYHRQEQRFALGVLGGIGVGGTVLAAASAHRARRAGQRVNA